MAKNNVNITPLLNNDKEFRNQVDELSRMYHSSWNDDVHESYCDYLKQMNSYSEDLHHDTQTIVAIHDEIQNKNFEELDRRISSLCAEVNSI